MKESNIALEILKIILWTFCGWILWLLIFSIFTPSEEELSDFLATLAFVLGVITGVVLTIILKYNRVNQLRQKIKESESNIGILHKKVEKLLNKADRVSDKYMQHEKEIQVGVSKNRGFKTAAEFQGVVEGYPELKANDSILELIRQIRENENQIANAKMYYNEDVLHYNVLIHNFPVSLVRKLFKIQDISYYEDDDMISDEKLGI